ncbi:NYN domain-containing protein [Georgenia sp. 311]|uniref:NYN domain-containing protein n=1 Tax=Georgenia wutianyii TaxID=2585135 RepID=A0ABX5VIP1_9MICO|nr:MULTISPECIES: NYN domain-containing protein [Georgenia]QDB78222.1 NYN domain-containing protein [Georgenia wutianyii]TNC16879.1 NYN domain-containing protein [Georgenia sp. 311]
MTDSPRTYLLIDGENIDATLGMSVLGRRPAPEERPRWDRILDFADAVFDQPAKGLFFLNASSGQMPMGFVQALLAMSFHPIPLAGAATEKVVDIGIQRTLEAIAQQPEGDVLLASHDGDFLPQVEQLVDAGRQVGIICFREFVNSHLTELTSRGLKIYDLEDDLGAFQTPLPRVRIIPLTSFDPMRYL